MTNSSPAGIACIPPSLITASAVEDAIAGAGEVRACRPAVEHVGLSLAALAQAFALLTDATGKSKGPELLALYAEHFAQRGVSAASVIRAVRRIVVDWDRAYWPSPEYIAVDALRLMRADRYPHTSSADMRDVADAMDATAYRQWEDRKERARAIYQRDPERGREIVARVTAEMQQEIKNRPRGMMATNVQYREAWRDGAIVGGLLAYEATRGARGAHSHHTTTTDAE